MDKKPLKWVRLANYANELSGKWLEILRESSCMLHGILQGCTNTMLKVSKEIENYSNKYIRLHLRLLFVMLEVSKALYTYMNRMKPLYTQILQWLPHYLIQSRSHCNSNFKSKRVLIWRNNSKYFLIWSFNSKKILIQSFGQKFELQALV